MESDIIIESPARNRYSMYDFSSLPVRQHPVSRVHSFNVSELPQRSRSVMNLSAPAAHFKKRTWVLPESPTVSETQSQLTKRRTLAGTLSPPAPKVPSVERYLEIFSKLKASYGGFLKALEEFDRSELSVKENLLFEKCFRKLSQKLQKIHDLHELYIHQEHMREGACNLIKTMERENSKKIRDRIDDVKSNYKKNILRLCAVEDEINNLAGSMKIQIIGLIGFARLSPGDVYGVQFKHAHEKSSSKCRVVGQGQKWTNPISSFRIGLLQDLQVKVHEVRKMNSNNIGVVSCPIANFISPVGQEFVLPVNNTGTLKLKLGAVWSPFSNKEETAFRGKITITEFPNARLDSLSNSSQPASPCSTPKNGTLSSMPRISCENGTFSSMRVSVNGEYLTPQASVITHWKNNEDATASQATLVEREDSTWVTSIKSTSMPNIAELSATDSNDNNESNAVEADVSKSEPIDSITGPDIPVEKKLPPEVKKKPRPVTLGPTFTSAHIFPPDYENVTINSVGSCGKLELHSKEGKDADVSVEKIRPKSLGPSFKVIPSPDYSPPTSPLRNAFPQIPAIIETDYSLQESAANTSASNSSAVIPGTTATAEEDKTTVSEDSTAATENLTMLQETNTAVFAGSSVIHYNAASAPQDSTDAVSKIDVASELSSLEDDPTAAIRSLFLQMMIKIATFPEDIRARLEKLQNVIEQLTSLMQEKQKIHLARTVSVENALNSIDSAFDFLAEHQTLKPSPKTDQPGDQIYPHKYEAVKEVLHHHLLFCQTLLEMVGASTASPLTAKTNECSNHLARQTDVLENLQKLLTSPEDVSSISACKQLENSSWLWHLWDESSKENELFCTSHQMLQTLRKNDFGEEVCTTVLDRMRTIPRYSPDSDIVSVFQFADFFTRLGSADSVSYLQDVNKELRCLKALKSTDDLVVLSTIQDRRMVPLVTSCLQHLALLLTNKNKTIQNVATNFLTKIPNNVKAQAIDIYIEMLEADDESHRVGACHALSILEAINARDQIVYVWRNDEREVRKAAFETLKVVGFPEGLTPTPTRRTGYAEVSTRL